MSTTNPTDISTEWEDLQVKHGNYEPRKKGITNEELSNIAIDFAEQHDPLADKSLKQLDRLEDEVDESVLQSYRDRRLAEMKAAAEKKKFGVVRHLGKDEYLTEVTDASKEVPVVLLLYKESIETSVLLSQCLAVIARKFGEVKFCKAIANSVIDNYPERKIPAVLIYKEGVCAAQLIGAEIWGASRMTPDTVEWVLSVNRVIDTEMEEDPRKAILEGRRVRRRGKGGDASTSESSGDSEDDREYSSLKVGRKKYRNYS